MAMWGRAFANCMTVVAVCGGVVLASATCGGSSGSGGPGGATNDAATDGAASDGAAQDSAVIPACTAAFGAVVSLASATPGSRVVLEGTLLRAPNFIKPLPAGSSCTDGSRAVELLPSDDPNNPVFVSDGSDAYCGCPATDSALCVRLVFGPKVRVRGTLQHTTSMGPCNQDPCYRVAFEDVCIAP